MFNIIFVFFVCFTFIEAEYESAFACEFSALSINCKRNEYIEIGSAIYGRISSKICQSDWMKNQNCRAGSAATIVKNRCYGRGSCTIPASNDLFGDPCAATYKYLEVHYKCVPKPPCATSQFQCSQGDCVDATLRCDGKWDCENGEDEAECSYLTEIACENTTLTVRCQKEYDINIIGANYGRQVPYMCIYQSRVGCVTPQATGILKYRCNGKKFCSIAASNAEFGDPCYATVKYLSVHYECVNNQLINELVS